MEHESKKAGSSREKKTYTQVGLSSLIFISLNRLLFEKVKDSNGHFYTHLQKCEISHLPSTNPLA